MRKYKIVKLLIERRIASGTNGKERTWANWNASNFYREPMALEYHWSFGPVFYKPIWECNFSGSPSFHDLARCFINAANVSVGRIVRHVIRFAFYRSTCMHDRIIRYDSSEFPIQKSLARRKTAENRKFKNYKVLWIYDFSLWNYDSSLWYFNIRNVLEQIEAEYRRASIALSLEKLKMIFH